MVKSEVMSRNHMPLIVRPASKDNIDHVTARVSSTASPTHARVAGHTHHLFRQVRALSRALLALITGGQFTHETHGESCRIRFV